MALPGNPRLHPQEPQGGKSVPWSCPLIKTFLCVISLLLLTMLCKQATESPECLGAAAGCLAESASQAPRAGAALGHLYSWAVRTVPKSGNYGNEAYLRLWLGCARHQWHAASSPPCASWTPPRPAACRP